GLWSERHGSVQPVWTARSPRPSAPMITICTCPDGSVRWNRMRELSGDHFGSSSMMPLDQGVITRRSLPSALALTICAASKSGLNRIQAIRPAVVLAWACEAAGRRPIASRHVSAVKMYLDMAATLRRPCGRHMQAIPRRDEGYPLGAAGAGGRESPNRDQRARVAGVRRLGAVRRLDRARPDRRADGARGRD